MLKSLIDEFLPDLDGAIAKKLLRDLEDAGERIAVAEGAKLAARGLVKGIDAFAAVAVRHLSPVDAADLTDSYVEMLKEQIEQLTEAISDYAPLALDVEANKKRHGTKSAEANAARQRREVGIAEMRQEVKDVLLAAIGDETAD